MTSNQSAKVIGLDGYRQATRIEHGGDQTTLLAIKLQQTLEVSRLMQTFCEHAIDILSADSVTYKNQKPVFNYQIGEVHAHLCRYQLELNEQLLGEIKFSRAYPFSIKETHQIEHLLGLLIYPLRNSLMYQKAVDEAFRDPLTRIGNRGAFDEALARETSAFKRHMAGFSLMVIDIDHFKKVNDTYGHIAGDGVLKSVANRIRNTLRNSDQVFRYGGEEFVVILSNTDLEGARFIAERIRKEIKKIGEKEKAANGIEVTASIGISAANSIKDVEDTLYHADKALYEAKESGRDRVMVRP